MVPRVGPGKESIPPARGRTLPVVDHKDENEQGKLNVPRVTMTINPDLIVSDESRFPEQWTSSFARAIFEEAAHGLDIGSGQKSAKEAWAAEVRFHNAREPRMDQFERELQEFLSNLVYY